MADEADMSDSRIQLGIDQAIAQARSAPALRPNGKCHFCDECVTGKLLFCNQDCSQDHRNEEEQLRRMGR